MFPYQCHLFATTLLNKLLTFPEIRRQPCVSMNMKICSLECKNKGATFVLFLGLRYPESMSKKLQVNSYVDFFLEKTSRDQVCTKHFSKNLSGHSQKLLSLGNYRVLQSENRTITTLNNTEQNPQRALSNSQLFSRYWHSRKPIQNWPRGFILRKSVFSKFSFSHPSLMAHC